MNPLISVPAWVICTDVGGASYFFQFRKENGADIPMWCANLEKAKRFYSLGVLMEYLSTLPAYYKAYEEDPRFIQWRWNNHEEKPKE